MCNRVYLAGPEVSLANARQVGARKLAICARHGLIGVYPNERCNNPQLSRRLPTSRAIRNESIYTSLR
jgi:nucleoside 2-deoxyribosyltransferase